MHVSSPNFEPGQPIPGEFAFAIPATEGHVALSQNRNPEVVWGDVPEGTQSFVLTLIDDDVPTRPDDVNQEGREVPADLARCEFVHWLMANIPADVRQLAAGACSDGITARGKTNPPGPAGSVQGENDYTAWFATDPDMQGQYTGYDGPCPPWNDSLVHHYQLTVYALSTPHLDLQPGFTLTELREALEGQVLASASVMGTYTLNPRLRAIAAT